MIRTLQEVVSQHYGQPATVVYDCDHWYVSLEDGSRASFNVVSGKLELGPTYTGES